MAQYAQRSFSGGILSPILRGRADQQKYLTGLRTCRNFLPIAAGPAVNRAGFEYIGEVKDSAAGPPRLLPFVFSLTQAYVLEFGDTYGRVWRDGASVGPTYEFSTPYALADTMDLKYAQSSDVMTLAHQGYDVRELSRIAEATWSVDTPVFGVAQDPPTGLSAVAGRPGDVSIPVGLTAVGGNAALQPPDRYIVAAFDGEIFDQDYSLTDVVEASVGQADAANPVVLNWTDGAVPGAANRVFKYSFATGDYRYIDATATATAITGTDDGIVADGYALPDPTGVVPFSYVVTSVNEDGVESLASDPAEGSALTPNSNHPNVLTWTAADDAEEYNIYATLHGVYGYIGSSSGLTFSDPNIAPDTTRQPPELTGLFDGAGSRPATVFYFQQRLGFANYTDEPSRVDLSRVGSFHEFTISSPVQDDDAISFVAAGNQQNDIRHLVGLSTLFMFTNSGEWTANGDGGGTITPLAINLRQQGYRGAATLAPIAIENTALYVQARGSVIRDLMYDWQNNGYKGRDLTIFAPHLFENHTIIDWAYQQMPHSVIWAVRDDGVLLSLTYNREQEVWGWAQHDTADGDTFERICCVPEGLEDAVYVVVLRTVEDAPRRYIERLHTRIVNDVTTDAFFVDSGLTYDGRNTDEDVTLTLSGGSTWAYTELLTLTASAATFEAEDVGKAFMLTIADVVTTLRVTAFNSTTEVEGYCLTNVPAAAQGVATSEWARAVKVVEGLDHLEGRTVSALSDGNPETGLTVVDGSITLQRFGAVIHAGLPIVADIGSLDWENPQQGTQMDKMKRINRVTLAVEAARGFEVGEDETRLTPYTHRIDEHPGDPAYLLSSNVDIPIKATWNKGGRVFLRQSVPLPVTVCAVAITGLESA